MHTFYGKLFLSILLENLSDYLAYVIAVTNAYVGKDGVYIILVVLEQSLSKWVGNRTTFM